MIKAIIFDCFGVLFPDTFWTLSSNHLGDDFSGKKQVLHDLIGRVDIGHLTRDELWDEFSEIVGQDRSKIDEDLKDMGGLDNRLLSFIEDNKSKYKFGMISNVGQGFIERMFTDKPADYYFDSLVLSSSVGLVKPDKRIYELSAKDLGCKPDECVFIDDIENNSNGATKAGMHGLLYVSYQRLMDDLAKLGI